MHLLVLSAFRLGGLTVTPGIAWKNGLNAPSGAQCFPTAGYSANMYALHVGLNAPSGAQCFPTRASS